MYKFPAKFLYLFMQFFHKKSSSLFRINLSSTQKKLTWERDYNCVLFIYYSQLQILLIRGLGKEAVIPGCPYHLFAINVASDLQKYALYKIISSVFFYFLYLTFNSLLPNF